MDGQQLAQCLKRRVLGGYVRWLHRIDPQVADHILEAQRQAFLAGASFFQSEVGHAERAQAKIRAKAAPPAATPPVPPEDSPE